MKEFFEALLEGPVGFFIVVPFIFIGIPMIAGALAGALFGPLAGIPVGFGTFAGLVAWLKPKF
jgi:hypothetical protein